MLFLQQIYFAFQSNGGFVKKEEDFIQNEGDIVIFKKKILRKKRRKFQKTNLVILITWQLTNGRNNR